MPNSNFSCPLRREIVARQNDRHRRADQREDFQHAREVVENEAAAEGDELAGRKPQDDQAGNDQQAECRPVDGLRDALAREGSIDDQHHRADCEHDLGQRRQQRGDGAHFVTVAAAPPPISAAFFGATAA